MRKLIKSKIPKTKRCFKFSHHIVISIIFTKQIACNPALKHSSDKVTIIVYKRWSANSILDSIQKNHTRNIEWNLKEEYFHICRHHFSEHLPTLLTRPIRMIQLSSQSGIRHSNQPQIWNTTAVSTLLQYSKYAFCLLPTQLQFPHYYNIASMPSAACQHNFKKIRKASSQPLLPKWPQKRVKSYTVNVYNTEVVFKQQLQCCPVMHQPSSLSWTDNP